MQPMMTMADPTAVVGKRVGAVIIDFVLMAVIGTAISFLFLDIETMAYAEAPASLRRDCGTNDTYGNDPYDGFGSDDYYGPGNDNMVGSSMCFHIGDTIWFVNGGPQGLVNLIQLVIGGAIFWWWQGTTGKTPGKAAFGIRTVNAAGAPPGVLAAFLRSILWFVDAFPFCIPGLVGFIAASSSKGHRRVGDMVASTYVVDKDAVGFPVPAAGGAPMPGATGWGTPMPAAPPPGAPMAGGAFAPPPAAAPPQAAPAPAADPTQPQWDEARKAYIAWDATAQRWQQYDEPSGTWTPI